MLYEYALLANWLLAGAGALISLMPFDWFSDDDSSGDGSSYDVGTDTGTDVGGGATDPGTDTGAGTDTETDTGDSTEGDKVGYPQAVGSREDDSIAGTPYRDTIFGMAGNDIIAGEGGDDFIEGNIGDDILFGGSGDDIVAGGGGTDTIYGGDGNDILGSDRLDEKADWSRGEAEVLDGGNGNDALYFTSMNTAIGGQGADSFNYVVREGAPALIRDFDPSVDGLVVYLDPELQDTSAQLEYSVDTTTNTTAVSLSGNHIITLVGQFDEGDIAAKIATVSDLTYR